MAAMNVMTPGPMIQKQREPTPGWPRLARLLVLSLSLLPIPTCGRVPSPEQPKEPLGSLTSVGEVYVNELAAPAESTIFSGDRLRTGENGTATFAMSGKGTLKVAPKSQVVFTGSYLFTAELQAGTVVLSSGGNGIVLRAGDYVLIPSYREQSATSKIEGSSDSSFLISCLDGSVGVLTLEGKSGELLHAGQSLRISLKTELSPIFARPRRTGQILRPTWVLLGAGAIGAIVALAATQSGGKPSVSPSTP